jgi:hypothetical protein
MFLWQETSYPKRADAMALAIEYRFGLVDKVPHMIE